MISIINEATDFENRTGSLKNTSQHIQMKNLTAS